MDEFRAHLDGFEERRKKTDQMHVENQAAIASLQSDVTDIRDSQLRQEETYRKHATDDTAFQKKTEEAIQQLNELAPIIREKLIPAYDREQLKEKVWVLIKEQAKGASFWIGLLMSIGAFFYGLIWLISKLLPK